jgi:hypothetical protein
MSGISREEVANLARLARIEMSDAELDHLSGEMFRQPRIQFQLTMLFAKM